MCHEFIEIYVCHEFIEIYACRHKSLTSAYFQIFYTYQIWDRKVDVR